MAPATRLTILVGLTVGFVLVWGLAAFVGGGWPNLRRNLPLIGIGLGVLTASVGGIWLMSLNHPLLAPAVYLVVAVIGWVWAERRTRRQPAEVREAQRLALQERRPLAIILTAVVLGYVAVAAYVAISVLPR